MFDLIKTSFQNDRCRRWGKLLLLLQSQPNNVLCPEGMDIWVLNYTTLFSKWVFFMPKVIITMDSDGSWETGKCLGGDGLFCAVRDYLPHLGYMQIKALIRQLDDTVALSYPVLFMTARAKDSHLFTSHGCPLCSINYCCISEHCALWHSNCEINICGNEASYPQIWWYDFWTLSEAILAAGDGVFNTVISLCLHLGESPPIRPPTHTQGSLSTLSSAPTQTSRQTFILHLLASPPSVSHSAAELSLRTVSSK